MADAVRFCSRCGAPLADRVPAGDDRLRRACTRCDHVHYQNPLPVVGCVVEDGDRVLLCQRAIEPRPGTWTLPAGFLEHGEGLQHGARRETREEAGAAVVITAPLAQLDLPHLGQTYALFRAVLQAPLQPHGPESRAVQWFAAAALPWAELAFPAVHFALRLWREDLAARRRHLHTAELHWSGQGSRFDAAAYRLHDHLRTPLG